MKRSNKDKYDFNVNSSNDIIGFAKFSAAGLHYFHFNDRDGETILFSQPYHSPTGRDNGIKSVKKNVLQKANILLHEDEEHHYFTIKSGNHQEVARSRNFDSIEELNFGLHFLKGYVGGNFTTKKRGITKPSTSKNDAEIVELNAQLEEKINIETDLRDKIWELESTLSETVEALNQNLKEKDNSIKEKAELEDKLVSLTKKIRSLELSSPKKETITTHSNEFQPSNYLFSVNFLNIDNFEDLQIVIERILTKEKIIIKGFDEITFLEVFKKQLPKPAQPIPLKIAATRNVTEVIAEAKPQEHFTISHQPINEGLEENNEIKNQENQETAISSIIPTVISVDKARNIHELKTMIKELKTEAVTPIKIEIPKVEIEKPKEIEDLPQTEEELALIEKMFGKVIPTDNSPSNQKPVTDFFEQKEADTVTVKISEEALLTNFFPISNSLAGSNERIVKTRTVAADTSPKNASHSSEELAIIEKMFGKAQILDKSPNNPKPVTDFFERKEVHSESTKGNLQEGTLVQKFFTSTNQSKATTSNLSRGITTPIEKPTINVPTEEELAIVQKFFGTTKDKKIISQKNQIAIQTEMNNLRFQTGIIKNQNQESEDNMLRGFFGATTTNKEVQKMVQPTNTVVQYELTSKSSISTEERATITQFFHQPVTETSINTHLSNIEQKEQAEDIILFNKLFGKNVSSSKNCKSC